MTARDTDADILKLMRAYLDAEYRWARDGEWPSLAIGQTAPGLETAFPDAGVFGLLSAWNPHSVERPEATNRAADAALHLALRDSGALYLPGFSSARNRSWREPSWLVFGMDSGEFDALSRRFGQLGTLWWKPGAAVRLRMDARKPDGIAGEPHVDWLR